MSEESCRKDPLVRFFEQLDETGKDLLRDYLEERSLESLSKSFDLLVARKNENKED